MTQRERIERRAKLAHRRGRIGEAFRLYMLAAEAETIRECAG